MQAEMCKHTHTEAGTQVQTHLHSHMLLQEHTHARTHTTHTTVDANDSEQIKEYTGEQDELYKPWLD